MIQSACFARQRFRYYASIMTLVSGLGLSACGFHLRGSEQALDLSERYRIEQSLAPKVAERLRESLQALGRLSDATDSAPTIMLANESFSRELTAIDSQGRASAYLQRLQVSVNLKSVSGSVDVNEAVRVEVAREQSYDATQALGSQEEEELLQEEMLTEMTRRIQSLLAARNRD